MVLTVKHNRANHTHENEQFRRVASSLIILFEQQKWTGILIGNPFNEIYPRFRADAILLYNHGFLIIDFKAYSGTLKLPRNKNDFELSQWYAESDDDKKRTLIKAGNKFINPFKQLNYYREAFKEIVKTEITLTGLIQESKTCAINIFSGPLVIQNSVPKELPFYKVTQESDLGSLLYDFSSETTYTEETANILCRIFNAEDWHDHIEFPKAKSLPERTFKIDKNVESAISEFLKTDSSGILVLESMSVQDRDNWVQYILSESSDFNIPQTETWIHSARIGRKASLRLGVELQSLYNTIYGGAPNSLETEGSEQEGTMSEEQIQEVITIRSDDSVDTSAVIILHEAHLVTRSLYQSELLRFGSGRLLEDLIKFLRLDVTKRKLICIGDPYSLTYGKDTDSAVNLNTLEELYGGKINHFRQTPLTNSKKGKLGLRNDLARSIENNLFNNLDFHWESNDLLEINNEMTSNYLIEWFTKPLDSEPTNTVLVYRNQDAKKINLWIKSNCIKNGKELAINDLLLVNNNINIPDETGFGHPTKLYNGMFLLVEGIGESITESIPIRQSTKPILLQFTKIIVKCLSLQTKLTTEIWMLNNYFQSEDKLSKEEQIAFRVLVNKRVMKEITNNPFENSIQFQNLKSDNEYIELESDEKKCINLLIENYTMARGEKHKVFTSQKVRTLLRKFYKRHKAYLLNEIIKTDPFVNAVHTKYGWSLTVHKCIGSTFTNAIFNTDQGNDKGITNAEYYRWLYSGITTTSGILQIVNAQKIHPLMDVHFEDTVKVINENVNIRRTYLTFNDYKIDERFKDKIPDILKHNIIGGICELAKLVEPLGYLLEDVKTSGDYLNKAYFSIPSTTNKQLIIAFHNKGEKDNWLVSSIRIEKAEEANEAKINECIEELFTSVKVLNSVNSLPFPKDFRGKIYENWKTILSQKGFKLEIIETHNNQDIFITSSGVKKAKFRVWYRNDGFISKIIILEKSDDSLGEKLKKWLIDGS